MDRLCDRTRAEFHQDVKESLSQGRICCDLTGGVSPARSESGRKTQRQSAFLPIAFAEGTHNLAKLLDTLAQKRPSGLCGEKISKPRRYTTVLQPLIAPAFEGWRHRPCKAGIFCAAEDLHGFGAQAHEINGQALGMEPDTRPSSHPCRKRKRVVHHAPPDLCKECMVSHPRESPGETRL